MKIRDIVITALLGALMLTVQVALGFLPNIELVSLLAMLFAVEFPRRITFGSIYVFALLEGLFYGFGSWWPAYLYVWTIGALAAYLLRHNDSALFWALVSAIFGLCFGALYAISYLPVGGVGYALSWWISGLPFDLLHCAGNFTTMLVLYHPLRQCFHYLSQQAFPEFHPPLSE